MTTTRHSFTSIATALAMAAALIAAMGPRVEAEEKAEDLTLTVTATCDDPARDEPWWNPSWSLIDGDDPDDLVEATALAEGDGTEVEIVAQIDLDWSPGLDACKGDVPPEGYVGVSVAYEDDGGWLSVTGECTEVPCEVEDRNFIELSVTVDGQSEGTATVTVTLTWTP